MALAGAIALGGCGYRPAHTARDPLGPFVIAGGSAVTPQASTLAAAEAGARAELARAGQLGSCTWGSSGCVGIEIEIVRVDESSAGVALEPRARPQGDLPLARAVEVTVTGRATLLDGPSGRAIRATGDASATEVFAREPEAALATVARDEAARLAARRLGERLVRRILGRAEP